MAVRLLCFVLLLSPASLSPFLTAPSSDSPLPTTHQRTKGAAIIKAAEEGTTSRFVLRTIWWCHYHRILAALCLQLCYSGVQFAGPLFLNQIVKFITLPESMQTVR